MATNGSNLSVPVELNDFALYMSATEGFLLLIFNVPIVSVILFQRILRQQKEYIIMSGLAFADILVGLGLAISGIMRAMLMHEGVAFIPTTKWSCFWAPWNIFFNWSNPANSYMLLLVSIDRYYAVFWPLEYFARTTSYAWKMLAGLTAFIALHVLIPGTITFFAARKLESPTYCFPAQGISANWFNNYIMMLKITAPLISVLLYYFIGRRIRKHITSVHGVSEENMAKKMLNLRQFTITLGISSVFTFFVLVLPLTYAYLAVPVFNAPTWPTMAHFMKTSANMNPVFNVLVYLIRQKQLRSGLKLMIRGKQMQLNYPSTYTMKNKT